MNYQRKQITQAEAKAQLFAYICDKPLPSQTIDRFLKLRCFLELLENAEEEEIYAKNQKSEEKSYSRKKNSANITLWFPVFPQEFLKMVTPKLTFRLSHPKS
jgi:hypothetical protein